MTYKINIYQKLLNVQLELKAPKGQRNKFGNYNYRSCEDILEALKPILSKHSAVVVLYDEIISIQDRIYVKAMVQFKDTKSEQSILTSAFAREALSKKGMDESQITGSCSSYARKYALNGMFLIDDTKDPDNDKPLTIQDQIDNSKTLEQLMSLYRSLSEDEQTQYTNSFSSRKERLNGNS